MSDVWTAQNMPDLSDQVIVVTGANSGVGRESSREFARRGATVVLACRNLERGEEAGSEIAADVGGASLDLRHLDLADLSSIETFATELIDDYERIDVLCNNAGLMAIPRRETVDGFEMQFGVNYLGHFALTGHLLPLLLKTPDCRVVTVSSSAYRFGAIRFEDLHWEDSYSKWGAYAQSKLANLLFAFELQRHLEEIDNDTISVATNPGLAHTKLAEKGPRMRGRMLLAKASGVFTQAFGQSAADGALPTLYAAVSSQIEGGEYVAPSGFAEMTGSPQVCEPIDKARDTGVARRLWQLSEGMTDVYFNFDHSSG